MKSFALFLFGLAAAAIVIGCKNPSSGTGTDTTPYTVTYNLNGGTGTVPTDANTYTVGQDVTAAAAPAAPTTPPHQKFAGWDTEADGSGTDVAAGGTIAMISGGLTLYAKWVTSYTVAYNLNGGTGATAPTDGDRYAADEDVTAAAAPTGLSPPAVDKKFAGWNTKADGSGTDAAVGGTIAMPSEDMTLYAKWVDAYTVTYNLNGGTGATAPTDSDRYASGDSVTAAAAPAGLTAPADKRFAGWNTENDGSGTDAAAGGTITMPSEDMTLYAKWVDITYTVTYNLNGGTGATAPTDDNTYASGASVTAAAAPAGLTAPADKRFDGWNTESDGSGTDVAAGTGTIAMPSGGGLILYAKWVDRTYTVTYNLNGGTGATAPIDTNTYTAGQVVTAAVAPTGLVPPTGKTFDGWNTEADGSGTDVTAGGTGTIAMPSGGGLILYAKWSN